MRDRPWSTIELPGELLSIPGMLSNEEKRYLIWLTSHTYEGWGAIVDLGCWLGCSSAALAEGLKRSGRATRVESRDLFAWEPCYMEHSYAANLPQDADFRPLFEKFTAPYREWIADRRSDLSKETWDGGPVEIFFVDAAKSWGLTNAIFNSFGPQIVPGKTRVIFQDFRHFSTPWLPLITDSRTDLWRECESVNDGWTVTFRTLKDVLGPEGMRLPYSANDFSLSSGQKIYRDRIEKSTGQSREFYTLGLEHLPNELG